VLGWSRPTGFLPASRTVPATPQVNRSQRADASTTLSVWTSLTLTADSPRLTLHGSSQINTRSSHGATETTNHPAAACPATAGIVAFPSRESGLMLFLAPY
jgi:hypothetical protein